MNGETTITTTDDQSLHRDRGRRNSRVDCEKSPTLHTEVRNDVLPSSSTVSNDGSTDSLFQGDVSFNVSSGPDPVPPLHSDGIVERDGNAHQFSHEGNGDDGSGPRDNFPGKDVEQEAPIEHQHLLGVIVGEVERARSRFASGGCAGAIASPAGFLQGGYRAVFTREDALISLPFFPIHRVFVEALINSKLIKANGNTTIGEVHQLAADLEAMLISSGWPLTAIQKGEVHAFAGCSVFTIDQEGEFAQL